MTEAVRALERWLGISRPVQAIASRLEAALAQRHAVSLSGYEVLSVLAARHGWTLMVDICEAVDLSQPRLSRLVAQLADEVLVERERVEVDGRAFQVRLTRKGRRVHGAAAATLVEVLKQAEAASGPVSELLRDGSVEAASD
ncbi:MarR family winged helix-turn-helix transcriptional regulator [Tomitella biformata]|uniref:MarR family winged helix-turn-helix transcriptional regulator n=1 Tax=Tomitella biformata TaxID=630403 RepID=UPI0004BB952A|nr:MarR family winged helix-turn-helix transcriptional regulator [Tomitella biformata]